MIQELHGNVKPDSKLDLSELPFFKPLSSGITKWQFLGIMEKQLCHCCQRWVDPVDLAANDNPIVLIPFQDDGENYTLKTKLCFQCLTELYIDTLRRLIDPLCDSWFNIDDQVRQNLKRGLI